MTHHLVAMGNVQDLFVFSESTFSFDGEHMNIANGAWGQAGLSLVAQKGANGLVNWLGSFNLGEFGAGFGRKLEFIDGILVVLAEG